MGTGQIVYLFFAILFISDILIEYKKELRTTINCAGEQVQAKHLIRIRKNCQEMGAVLCQRSS